VNNLFKKTSLQRLVGRVGGHYSSPHDHIGNKQIDFRGTIDNEPSFCRIEPLQRGVPPSGGI